LRTSSLTRPPRSARSRAYFSWCISTALIVTSSSAACTKLEFNLGFVKVLAWSGTATELSTSLGLSMFIAILS